MFNDNSGMPSSDIPPALHHHSFAQQFHWALWRCRGYLDADCRPLICLPPFLRSRENTNGATGVYPGFQKASAFPQNLSGRRLIWVCDFKYSCFILGWALLPNSPLRCRMPRVWARHLDFPVRCKYLNIYIYLIFIPFSYAHPCI